MVLRGEPATEHNYDRKTELMAFDETKIGVKGLVDAGITEVPRIFILPSPENLKFGQLWSPEINLPTIDLEGVNEDPIRQKDVIEKVKDALGNWGFFQLLNHGIPFSVLEGMIKGVAGFHEQDSEAKKEWYTRESNTTRRLVYNSNYNLYAAPVADWRDTFFCTMAPNPPCPHELPPSCRDILIEYSNHVMKLGVCLFELMSEALGLNPNHLIELRCAEGLSILGHYYPSCPQPELTLGTTNHTDSNFMTILLQDNIGGLQVFHDNHWIDVCPNPKSLIVNVGDLLQLITNDKFVSAQHRVLANKVGPRVSVASFFRTGAIETSKVYEPIKELLSEDNLAKYKGTTMENYLYHVRLGKGQNGIPDVLRLKI